MKLLLDHCVDRRLAAHLSSHEVHTAAEMRWALLRNGALLARAAEQRFDAMLTTDRGIKHQQNLKTLPVGVIVLLAHTNRLSDLLVLLPALEAALASAKPRELVEVGPPA